MRSPVARGSGRFPGSGTGLADTGLADTGLADTGLADTGLADTPWPAPSLAGDRLGGRVEHLQLLAVAEVHVHAARQAGVEAADGPHDVDSLEVLPVVLLEDRLPLDGVLVGPGRAEAVPRAGVPRRRRIRVVVRDLPVADDQVVAEHAAHGLGEAAADALLGHLEGLPRLRAPGPDLDQRLLREVERGRGRVGLEVGARPVPLERVAPPGDLPLEADRALERGLGEVDLHAGAGGLDVADVARVGQCGGPRPGQGTAAGVEGEVVPAVEPAGRHHPAVLVVQVPLLRVRIGVLV